MSVGGLIRGFASLPRAEFRGQILLLLLVLRRRRLGKRSRPDRLQANPGRRGGSRCIQHAPDPAGEPYFPLP